MEITAMKREPTIRFLRELAKALREAEHRNVAESFTAGLLWAMYPEWFDQQFRVGAEKANPLAGNAGDGEKWQSTRHSPRKSRPTRS